MAEYGVVASRQGLNPVSTGSGSATFARLLLSPGASHEGSVGTGESVLVLLSGRASIEAAGEQFTNVGERTSVFGGKPYSIYLPSDAAYRITALTQLEVAIFGAEGGASGPATLLRPSDVTEGVWGTANWANHFRLIFGPEPMPSPAQRLVVGETITPSGHWSTYPPHRHDRRALPSESSHQEIYFFKLAPKDGFGLMRVYDGADLDEHFTIHDDTMVAVADGFHTMVSAPGCVMYSLWFATGDDRAVAITHDPALGWLTHVETMRRWDLPCGCAQDKP